MAYNNLDDIKVLLASIVSTAIKDLRKLRGTSEATPSNDVYMSAYNMFFDKSFRLVLDEEEFSINELLLLIFPDGNPDVFINELKKELHVDELHQETLP